jgi:hypothetical protein
MEEIEIDCLVAGDPGVVGQIQRPGSMMTLPPRVCSCGNVANGKVPVVWPVDSLALMNNHHWPFHLTSDGLDLANWPSDNCCD